MTTACTVTLGIALSLYLAAALLFQGQFLLRKNGWDALGHIGFALSFCAAIASLIQHQALKKGRLNRYLPPLDTAAEGTFRFAGGGFSLFTLGLGMGVIWLFGAPGEHLAGEDTKIWLAMPTWLVFAVYLYLRGISQRHGRRLKWLVVAGFLLGLINLVGVRHDFDEQVGSTQPVTITDELA